jgi:N utilization substance protein B
MALQSLYAANLGGGSIDGIVAFVASEMGEPPSAEARSYCRELFSKALHEKERVDQIIAKKLEHWELKRVTLIDRLILELALVEMVYFPEVPLKVSISEAIEIAKIYSTDESPGFINGILDAVYRDILEGRLITEEK